MISVAAFTGGKAIPSARFRVRQYVPYLQEAGIRVHELPSRFGKYPPLSRLARPLWFGASLAEQLINVSRLRAYELVVLQREILSKSFTAERLIRGPILLDVDDAIFLFRSGYVARRLAQISDIVVCGNAYLAEHFSRWNSSIRVIPTAVDAQRYTPSAVASRSEQIIVGWIGTSSNLAELQAIEESIAAAFAKMPEAHLRVVCDRAPNFALLDSSRWSFVPWLEENEVSDIRAMDIGIMPMRDSAWARGKCSFKMLQYMACGLPSVVSAVGMNVEVAAKGDCCLLARSMSEWTDALVALIESSEMRTWLGKGAREVVLDHFSTDVLAPQLASAMKSVLR